MQCHLDYCMSDALLSAFPNTDSDLSSSVFETVTQSFSAEYDSPSSFTNVNISSKFSVVIAQIMSIGSVRVGSSSSSYQYSAKGVAPAIVVRNPSAVANADLMASYDQYCTAAACVRISTDGAVSFRPKSVNISNNVWISSCTVYFICLY